LRALNTVALACCAAVGQAQNAGATSDEVLVGLRRGPFVAQANQVPIIGRLVGHIDALNVHRIKIPADMTMSQVLAQYRSMPGVEFAEPNHAVHVASTPNDSLYANQYGPARVQADKAWDIWRPQGQVIVAIVDTGVDSGHPDLTNKILRDTSGIVGWNAYAIDPSTGQPKTRDNALDDYGHGTHCAGIAAAQSNNGLGVAGIAGWDGNAAHTDVSVKIMPVKVLQNGSGSDADVASGVTWAADHGARVISMSLGDSSYSSTLDAACTYAWNKGCVVVAAAGNSGSSAKFYPAANANVVSVAATDNTDTLASFSNWGTWVNVAAPGVSIYSTVPTYATSGGFGTNYNFLSGTSMATPHVAGEAALLLAAKPSLTNAQVVSAIENNVDTYLPYGGNTISATGGRINVYRALAQVLSNVPPAAPQGVTGSPNGTNILLAWQPEVADSFNIYRGVTAGGEGTVPYKTGVTGTAYTDTGALGKPYYYRVSALNSAGESPLSAEIAVSLDGSVYLVNSAGAAVGRLIADSYFSGGQTWSTTQAIDTSGVTNPAPMAAYQTLRYSTAGAQFGYSFPNLTPGGAYKLRLHFEEAGWSSAGKRLFSVSANGTSILSNFDVFAAAGAMFKAIVKEFSVTADSTGAINLSFAGTPGAVDPTPFVCAVEVVTDVPQAPSTPTGLTATAGNAQVVLNWSAVTNATSYNIYRATTAGGEGSTPYKTKVTAATFTDTGLTNGTTYYYKVSAVNAIGESPLSVEVNATPSSAAVTYHINSAGPAVGSFAADSFFSGGATWSTTQAIDTSGVTNPAPMAAYETLRYSSGGAQFGYSFPNLTPGGAYKLRLHFEEAGWSSAGKRLFSVSANGNTLLSSFDVYAAAGAMFKAIVKEFSVTADGSGTLSLTFTGTPGAVDPTPFVCAIEVVTDVPQAPSTPTGLTATAGNAQVVLNWTAVSNATSYNIYRATTAGGEGSTPYKSNVTSASFTDTGLTNGTTYFYRVTALNSVGESPQSSEVNAVPGSVLYQVNSAGPAVGTFAADSFFSGGQLWSTTQAIDTSGVTNPAPMAAYQTLRYSTGGAQFGYSFPNLTPGGAYKLRLHFQEAGWSSAGKRLFGVTANGTSILSSFDVYAAAGAMFKAIAKEFSVTADSTGAINLSFAGTPGAVDPTPFVCAIEVLPP
jgi:thermitase